MRYLGASHGHSLVGEAKYQTLLALSQAANARRELTSVLEAVMEALDGLVPVDLTGVVTRGTGGLRALAAHFHSAPRRPGESHGSYVDHGRRTAPQRSGVEAAHEIEERLLLPWLTPTGAETRFVAKAPSLRSHHCA
jgi:hypothetical protein